MLLAEMLDEPGARPGEFRAGGLHVGPDHLDLGLDELGAQMAGGAGDAVLLALALEVVVGAAVASVAGEHEA